MNWQSYMSSSSRRPALSDLAILNQQDRSTGPLMLPAQQADEFVAEFNRIYGPIGLCLRMKKSPDASGDAAGDSVQSVPDQ